MDNFGEFLKTWSLRSNSVTRQVSFNRTKIGGKCQNVKSSNATFWVIFKQCESRIACTLRTTRPGQANNNASKTSPLQAEPKNDPFSTGKIDHHSKHLRERENKAQHNVQTASDSWKGLLNISGNWEKKFWTHFLSFDALLEVWKFALLEADVLAGLALTRRDCCSVCS